MIFIRLHFVGPQYHTNSLPLEVLPGIEPSLFLITSEVHHHLCVRTICTVCRIRTDQIILMRDNCTPSTYGLCLVEPHEIESYPSALQADARTSYAKVPIILLPLLRFSLAHKGLKLFKDQQSLKDLSS